MSSRQQYDEVVPLDALRPHVDATRLAGIIQPGASSSVDAWRVPSLPSSSLTGVNVDESSSVTVRYYKLFCREAKGHVRVTTSKIDAKGSFDDPYSELISRFNNDKKNRIMIPLASPVIGLNFSF